MTVPRTSMIILMASVCVLSQEELKAIRQIRAPDLSLSSASVRHNNPVSQFTHRSDTDFSRSNRQESDVKPHRLPLESHQTHPFTPAKHVQRDQLHDHNRKVRNPQVVYTQPIHNDRPKTHPHKIKHHKNSHQPPEDHYTPDPVRKQKVPARHTLVQPEAITSAELELRNLNDPSVVEIREILPPTMTKYNEDGSLFTPKPHKVILPKGVLGHKLHDALPVRGKIPVLRHKHRKNRRPSYPIPGRTPPIVTRQHSNVNFRDQSKTHANLPHTFIPRSGHIDSHTTPYRSQVPEQVKRSIGNFGQRNFVNSIFKKERRHITDHTRLEIGDSDEVYVLRVPEDVLAKKQNTNKPYAMLLTAPSENSQKAHHESSEHRRKDESHGSWWKNLPFIKNFANEKSSNHRSENFVSASEIKNSFLPPPSHDKPHDPYLSQDAEGNYYYPSTAHAGQAAFESVPDILKPILNPIKRLVLPDEFRNPFRGGYAPYRPGYQYQYHVPYYPAPYHPSVYSAKKRTSSNHRTKNTRDHIEEKSFEVKEDKNYLDIKNNEAGTYPTDEEGISIIDTGTHYAVIQGDVSDYIKFEKRSMKGDTAPRLRSANRRMDDEQNHRSVPENPSKEQLNNDKHKKELIRKYEIQHKIRKDRNADNKVSLAEAIAKKSGGKPKSRQKRQLRTSFRRRRRYQNLPITRRSDIQTNYHNSANTRSNKVDWESTRNYPRRISQQRRRAFSPRRQINNFDELPNGQVAITRQFTNLIAPKIQLSAPFNAPKNILEVPPENLERVQSNPEKDDSSGGIQFGFEPLGKPFGDRHQGEKNVVQESPPNVITISSLTQPSLGHREEPNIFSEITLKSKIENKNTGISDQNKYHDEQNQIFPSPLRTESGFKPMTEFHGLPQKEADFLLHTVHSIPSHSEVLPDNIGSTTVEPVPATFLPTKNPVEFEAVRHTAPTLSEKTTSTESNGVQNELELNGLMAESSVLHSTVTRHDSRLITNSVVHPIDEPSKTESDVELKSTQQTQSSKPKLHFDIFNAETSNKKLPPRRKNFNREIVAESSRPIRRKVVRVTRVRNGGRRHSANGRRKNRFRRPALFGSAPNSHQQKRNKTQTHFVGAATHKPVVFGSKIAENHVYRKEHSQKSISTTAEPLDTSNDKFTTKRATTTNKPQTTENNWIRVIGDIKEPSRVDVRQSDKHKIIKNEVYQEMQDDRQQEKLIPDHKSTPSTTERPTTTPSQSTTQQTTEQEAIINVAADQKTKSEVTEKPVIQYNYLISRKRPSTLSKTFNVFNNRIYSHKRPSKTRYKIPTLPPTAASDDQSPHVQLQKYLNRYAEKYGLNRVNKTKHYSSLPSTSMPAAGLRWSQLKEETNNHEERNSASTPPSRIFDRQEWTQLLFEDNKVPSASQFSYRFQPPPSTFVRPKVKVPRLAALLNRSRSKSVTRTVTVPITERTTNIQAIRDTDKTEDSDTYVEYRHRKEPEINKNAEKTIENDPKDLFLIINDPPIIENESFVGTYSPTLRNAYNNQKQYESFPEEVIPNRPTVEVSDFFPIRNSAEFTDTDTDEPEGQSSVFSVVYTKEKPQITQPEIYNRLNKLLEDNGEKPINTLKMFSIASTEPPAILPQQEEMLSDDGTFIVQAKPPSILRSSPSNPPTFRPRTNKRGGPDMSGINNNIFEEVIYFKPVQKTAVTAKVEQIKETSADHHTAPPQSRDETTTTDSPHSASTSEPTWAPLKANPEEKISDKTAGYQATSRAIVAPVRESRSSDGALPFCLHGSCSLIYEPGRNIRVQH